MDKKRSDLQKSIIYNNFLISSFNTELKIHENIAYIEKWWKLSFYFFSRLVINLLSLIKQALSKTFNIIFLFIFFILFLNNFLTEYGHWVSMMYRIQFNRIFLFIWYFLNCLFYYALYQWVHSLINFWLILYAFFKNCLSLWSCLLIVDECVN